MLRLPLIASLLLLSPATAIAQDRQITSRSEFVSKVANRDLTRLGIGVRVSPGGQISGSAFGTKLTGTWNWDGRVFCREMQWGQRTFDYSCQSVILRDDRVYFQPRSGNAVYLNLG